MTAINPLIHLWMPGLFDFKGGIQVYSSFLLKALQNTYPQAQPEVFLMHDRCPGQGDQDVHFHCAGKYPSSLRSVVFASQVITAGLLQKPNLVLSTHLNFTVAAYRLKQMTGVPYWAVAHGFEAWEVQRPALRRAIAAADRILAVSHYTRDRLLQSQNLNPDQVVLLPNTFDADRFQIGPKPTHLLTKYGLNPNQPVILTVNRLAEGESYHSYDRVLAALPQIRQVLPDVRYLIVGQGGDRPRLERLIAQENLQDSVTLTGFVPDSELPDYYNLCDVFAMPSKLEGFGIVYLEALACGKPVLGSNQDGSIDALCQGQLGALIHPDQTSEIAETLIGILRRVYPNPLMYQPAALRQSAISTFGFSRFQQTLKSLLQTMPRISNHSNSTLIPAVLP